MVLVGCVILWRQGLCTDVLQTSYGGTSCERITQITRLQFIIEFNFFNPILENFNTVKIFLHKIVRFGPEVTKFADYEPKWV